MLVPRPAAVWISNFPSICEALVRMLLNPKPSLFSRLALEKLYSGFSQKLIRVSPLSSDSGQHGRSRPRCVFNFIPEAERLHGIIECVVSADELTSTPRKIVSS